MLDRTLRRRCDASATDNPAKVTGPTFEMNILPSGDMVLSTVICESPHTSTITSSPGPRT